MEEKDKRTNHKDEGEISEYLLVLIFVIFVIMEKKAKNGPVRNVSGISVQKLFNGADNSNFWLIDVDGSRSF